LTVVSMWQRRFILSNIRYNLTTMHAENLQILLALEILYMRIRYKEVDLFWGNVYWSIIDYRKLKNGSVFLCFIKIRYLEQTMCMIILASFINWLLGEFFILFESLVFNQSLYFHLICEYIRYWPLVW